MEERVGYLGRREGGKLYDFFRATVALQVVSTLTQELRVYKIKNQNSGKPSQAYVLKKIHFKRLRNLI